MQHNNFTIDLKQPPVHARSSNLLGAQECQLGKLTIPIWPKQPSPPRPLPKLIRSDSPMTTMTMMNPTPTLPILSP